MKCKICHTDLTQEEWSHERWRLYRRGYQRKQVNQVMTLCHKDMSAWIYRHHTKFTKHITQGDES